MAMSYVALCIVPPIQRVKDDGDGTAKRIVASGIVVVGPGSRSGHTTGCVPASEPPARPVLGRHVPSAPFSAPATGPSADFVITLLSHC